MNLAKACIREFSKFGPDQLFGPIEARMPQHFLLSTLELQASLRPAAEPIQEIADLLAAPNGSEPWRNPEVYWQITRLARGGEAAADPQPILESLRTQAGITRLAEADLADGLHRLVCTEGGVYRVRDGVKTEVEDVVMEADGFRGHVLLPYDGLFADMLENRLYPSFASEGPWSEIRGRLTQAVDLVAAYSTELFDDIQEVVRLLVLTPDLEDAQRWSYNLRMAYFGAIFINPYAIGVFGIAESLIHEYCHQRLWQWWAYDPPAGLPATDLEVHSPVTGRMKPFEVMIHALVVYVLANDFYTWALESERGPGEERDWICRRQKHLAQGIPCLHRTLLEQVETGTTLQAMLDYLLERFETARA